MIWPAMPPAMPVVSSFSRAAGERVYCQKGPRLVRFRKNVRFISVCCRFDPRFSPKLGHRKMLGWLLALAPLARSAPRAAPALAQAPTRQSSRSCPHRTERRPTPPSPWTEAPARPRHCPLALGTSSRLPPPRTPMLHSDTPPRPPPRAHSRPSSHARSAGCWQQEEC